ncbi:hypothetical protein G3O08_05135 [Cryomorpha ignava]|uniref:DUF5606 domain-containing protein n=1 Tax=Cryomorpha ignava TaxID=101383 RepID=A0A7K3WMK0_9FLAO|nr:DUF5606 domain-containing protein [Cryomorpha ignava]NEN22880.1 hypothetical protein [Cryomorpha ignava]
MDLSKILSIAGKPGLYQIVNQSRGGVVAKSLLDGKKISIGQTQRVSTLSDISIYVEDGDEPLVNVLKTINEKYGDKELDIDLKDNDALRNLMSEMLPEYDEDRVYASDIKKMVKWYNLLLKNDILDFTEVPEEEKEEEAKEKEETEEKPKAKKAEANPTKKSEAKPKPNKTAEKKPAAKKGK